MSTILSPRQSRRVRYIAREAMGVPSDMSLNTEMAAIKAPETIEQVAVNMSQVSELSKESQQRMGMPEDEYIENCRIGPETMNLLKNDRRAYYLAAQKAYMMDPSTAQIAQAQTPAQRAVAIAALARQMERDANGADLTMAANAIYIVVVLALGIFFVQNKSKYHTFQENANGSELLMKIFFPASSYPHLIVIGVMACLQAFAHIELSRRLRHTALLHVAQILQLASAYFYFLALQETSNAPLRRKFLMIAFVISLIQGFALITSISAFNFLPFFGGSNANLVKQAAICRFEQMGAANPADARISFTAQFSIIGSILSCAYMSTAYFYMYKTADTA